jgi:hypothetical protein
VSQTFDQTPLPKALFRANDLSSAYFDRGWLKGATFSHCNLGGVAIRRCDIAGMTIDGVRVDLLLEAELDRLDPRRVHVRIGNRYEVAQVRRAVGQLEKVREQFCQHLRAAQPAHLAARTGDWQWSALQHLRHLVFAEELYTDRWILRNDEPFSPLGLLPNWLEGKPGYQAVGTNPTQHLEAVVAAWDRVHVRTQKVLLTLTEDTLRTSTKGLDFGQGDIAGVFGTLTGHDLYHIRAAEGVLADVSRP